MIAALASAIPAYTVSTGVLHWFIVALILPMAPGINVASEWGGPPQPLLHDLLTSIRAAYQRHFLRRERVPTRILTG
jgi:hypothetical protein